MIHLTSATLRGPEGLVFVARQISPGPVAPLRWHFVALAQDNIQELDAAAIERVLYSSRNTKTWMPGEYPMSSLADLAWQIVQLIDPVQDGRNPLNESTWSVVRVLMRLAWRDPYAALDGSAGARPFQRGGA